MLFLNQLQVTPQIGEIIILPEDNLKGLQRPISGIYTEEGCLICNSHSSNPHGYCYIGRNGKSDYVHRYVFSKWCEEIPKGFMVLHECDNPACFNPEHLKLGTQQDNMADKISRGRQPIGSNIPSSKLTEGDVYFIRFISDDSRKFLAENFNVSVSTITRVKNKSMWKHVTINSKWRNDVA